VQEEDTKKSFRTAKTRGLSPPRPVRRTSEQNIGGIINKASILLFHPFKVVAIVVIFVVVVVVVAVEIIIMVSRPSSTGMVINLTVTLDDLQLAHTRLRQMFAKRLGVLPKQQLCRLSGVRIVRNWRSTTQRTFFRVFAKLTKYLTTTENT